MANNRSQRNWLKNIQDGLCIITFNFEWIMIEDGTRWIKRIFRDWPKDMRQEVLETDSEAGENPVQSGINFSKLKGHADSGLIWTV